MGITGNITGAMAAITANNPRRGVGHLGAVLAALGLGALLVALAAPRLPAAILARDADPVLGSLYAGAALSPDALEAGIAALAAAERWHDFPPFTLRRGLLLARAAEGSGDPKARAVAMGVLGKALAGGPGEPGAWLQLARLRAANGEGAAARAALRQSILTGALVPPMMLNRLDTAFALLPGAGPDLRALLLRQIRLTWVLDPQALLARIADPRFGPEVGPLIITALAELTPSETRHYRQRHRPVTPD